MVNLDLDLLNEWAEEWPQGTTFLLLARHILKFRSVSEYIVGAGVKDYADWAVNALLEGYEAPSLNILAGLDIGETVSIWDAERYFDRCIRELELEFPDNAEPLLRAYLSELVSQIASGEADPHEALDKIHWRIVNPLGHSEDLMPWCYLWEGNTPGGHQGRYSEDEHREAVVAYAQSWIKNGPDVRLPWLGESEELEVTCTPNPVKARRGGPNGQRYEWVFETKVRAVDKPVRILDFGTFSRDRGRWVFTTPTGRPFSAKDFADWYSCPRAILRPGESFSTLNTVSSRDLREWQASWYFRGVTPPGGGVVVKGTAGVSGLAVLEAKGDVAGALSQDDSVAAGAGGVSVGREVYSGFQLGGAHIFFRSPEPAVPLPDYIPASPPDPGRLQDPGKLPPGSRVPFQRNGSFTGRVQPLLDLARARLDDDAPATVVSQVAGGMGGAGKTQLAVEFAYRYGRFFRGVHWIEAAQPGLIGAEISECGRAMALVRWPRKLPDQVERTLEVWRWAGRRLVIVDNLEDVDAARQWLPRLRDSGVSLVLTSRRGDWPADLGLRPLPLDLFTPAESLAFLREHLPAYRALDADLASLAEHLGRLPLALDLAGRYLAGQRRLTVQGYLDKLDGVFAGTAMAGWRAELGNPTGHDLDLTAAIYRSWQEASDEAARRLFRVCGYCAPSQPVPRYLLERAADLDRDAYEAALSILTGLGLLEIAGTGLDPIIHPAVAEYARTLPGASEALSALMGALVRLTREACNIFHAPLHFGALRPHLVNCQALLARR